MGNDNSDDITYTSIRVDSETARKLKALSGMNDKPILRVIEDLVRDAFTSRVKEISSNPDNF